MATTITTLDSAAAVISEHLGLSAEDCASALRDHRAAFGRWEDLTGETLERVERLVWDQLTDGAEWPHADRETADTWTFYDYWNVVLGDRRDASDVVREFGLTRDGLDEWLATAESAAITACLVDRDATLRAWTGYHAKALATLAEVIAIESAARATAQVFHDEFPDLDEPSVDWTSEAWTVDREKIGVDTEAAWDLYCAAVEREVARLCE